MSRQTTRFAALLAAFLMLAFTVAQPAAQARARGAEKSAAEARFEFTDVSGGLFVIQLTDPTRIQQARDILSGAETRVIRVMGIVVTSPAPYNPRWAYHLDSKSIAFFSSAIEVCDATITYVEEHLDEVGGAFLPGNQWCPWSSRLTRELPIA